MRSVTMYFESEPALDDFVKEIIKRINIVPEVQKTLGFCLHLKYEDFYKLFELKK